MKVRLLDRDRDVDLEVNPPPETIALVADLGIEALLAAAGADDPHPRDIVRRVMLRPLTDPDAIRYRQGILVDCLAHPTAVRALYALAVEAIEREHKVWGWASTRSPDGLLNRSVEVLGVLLGILKRLRAMAETDGVAFESEGFRRFFAMIRTDLDNSYLAVVADHLSRLKFDDGIIVTAGLGRGNRGTGYVLRKRVRRRGWRDRLGLADRPGFVYSIPERDENGLRMMAEVADRGIALAAGALGQSTDNIVSFFKVLRSELAFYVGLLNLHGALEARGTPTCIPEPSAGDPTLVATRLYDLGLALGGAGQVVGNDIDARGRSLIVITGPNEGGKTALLRGLGQAQLLMQAGAFVPAESFTADIRGAIFTHFRREEDVDLRSGKLDEELRRMSGTVDAMPPGALILLNESFSSTNEREGSEIARQITHGLLDAGVKIAYVTHLFDLARGLYEEGRPDALFLRAERLPDGTRTFRLRVAEPLRTSFGADVYRQVFPDGASAVRSGSGAAPVSAGS
jgi:hypothetical protein